MDMDRIAGAYIKLRDAKAAIAKKAREDVKEIEEKQDKLEAVMLKQLKELGVKSANTEHGTIIKSIKVRVWAPDPEAFRAFIMENDALDLLENRIVQSNFKQFIEDNPELKPPVNVDRKYVVTVRRTSK